MAAIMSLSSGAKLGQYEIIAPIGAGGMGEVYRAHDLHLGRGGYRHAGSLGRYRKVALVPWESVKALTVSTKRNSGAAGNAPISAA